MVLQMAVFHPFLVTKGERERKGQSSNTGLTDLYHYV